MFCSKSVAWLYRADKSFSWDSGIPVQADQVFLDATGKVRLVIETSGRMTVTRGYSWNGCSPKFCVLDLLIGTPDGVVDADTGRPKTYFASMVHDALYQFLQAESPISRREADRCFLRLLTESHFALRYVYWAAVRVFGRLVWHGKRVTRRWAGRRLVIADLSEPSLRT